MYSGLLSVDVTLLLRIATKSLSKMFVAYNLVLMFILSSLFRCLKVLHLFYLLIFP